MEETKEIINEFRLEYIALLINTDEVEDMSFKEFKWWKLNKKNNSHVNDNMSKLLNYELMLKLVDLIIEIESELLDKKAKNGAYKMSQFISRVHKLLSSYNTRDMIKHKYLKDILHIDKTEVSDIIEQTKYLNSQLEISNMSNELNSTIVTVGLQMFQLIKEGGLNI